MPENRIRELRLKKKLSQKGLAKKAETSQQQIQRIEAGIQAARFDLAVRISVALEEPLDRVFPTIELPLKRAKRRHATVPDLFSDHELADEFESAGLDMDPAQSVLLYRLRGGAEGKWWLAPGEMRRVWSLIQRDDENEFMLFDAGGRRYAVNPAHLMFVHFLKEYADGGEESDSRTQPAQRREAGRLFNADGEFVGEYEVRVTLADGCEMTFSVDPDDGSLEEEDPEPLSVQLQDLFFYAQLGGQQRLKLTDEDGEVAWFRTQDVAMFSVPIEAVEPKLRAAADEDEEAVPPQQVTT